MLNIELVGTANSIKHLGDLLNPHFKFVLLGRPRGINYWELSSGSHAFPSQWGLT
jgi:hypothetical protein